MFFFIICFFFLENNNVFITYGLGFDAAQSGPAGVYRETLDNNTSPPPCLYSVFVNASVYSSSKMLREAARKLFFCGQSTKRGGGVRGNPLGEKEEEKNVFF